MPRAIKKPLVVKFGDQATKSPYINHQLNEAKMNINSKSNNGNRKIFAKFILVKNNHQKTIYLEGQNAKIIIEFQMTGHSTCLFYLFLVGNITDSIVNHLLFLHPVCYI